MKDIDGIEVPLIKPGAKHVFHQYTIKVKDHKLTRGELITYLKKNEIGCGIYYPKPLHMHQHFMKLGYKEGDFSVSEKLSKEVISLPVHPAVSDEDINKIIEVIQNA